VSTPSRPYREIPRGGKGFARQIIHVMNDVLDLKWVMRQLEFFLGLLARFDEVPETWAFPRLQGPFFLSSS
jgi:hypothetical protein